MRKYLVFLVIGAVSSLITFALFVFSVSFIHHVDLKLKDARFLLRGELKPPSTVAVVAIDNKSIKEIGRWPWSRDVFAGLINGLSHYGVKVTALDIVFSEAQGKAPDTALAKGIASAGNIIMGYFFRNEEQVMDPVVLEQVASSKIKLLRIGQGVTSVPLSEYAGMDANISSLGKEALGFGFFNAIADSDGLFRKSPLLMLYDGDVYPSLALKALTHFLGEDSVVDVADFGISSIGIGSYTVPVNERGELALNYYGPTGSFPTYSAVDVIKKRLPENTLKDKLVFVGATEIGIYDVRATPFDAILPGVEIHATVAANTIEKKFIIHDSRTKLLELAAIIIFPLILALLLGSSPSTLIGFLYGSIITAGYLLINYLLFRKYLLDLSILYPVFSLALTTVSSEVYRSLVIDKKGRYMKKAFSNYVSADLVAQIMKNPDSLKLGGEKREITILFSDIRGFTTLSESLSPEALVMVLNEYLSPMTRIVLEEKGTLDKYIGDAVMAIYNAPLDVDNHAEHACRSAIKMLEKLEELNRSFIEKGVQPIDIGIGMNTGDAVVGNMGADIRFDYTAIGDNVNLASRLEGLNKMYGTHILVSDSTRKHVKANFTFRELDLVAVKGKHLPVPIYELLTSENKQLDEKFSHGLKLYRNKEFAAALLVFEDLLASTGDIPSKLYIERCRDFMSVPPPAEWNGVYVAKTK